MLVTPHETVSCKLYNPLLLGWHYILAMSTMILVYWFCLFIDVSTRAYLQRSQFLFLLSHLFALFPDFWEDSFSYCLVISILIRL